MTFYCLFLSLERVPFEDGTTCKSTLAQSREKNVEKVASYRFPEAEKYSKGEHFLYLCQVSTFI